MDCFDNESRAIPVANSTTYTLFSCRTYTRRTNPFWNEKSLDTYSSRGQQFIPVQQKKEFLSHSIHVWFQDSKIKEMCKTLVNSRPIVKMVTKVNRGHNIIYNKIGYGIRFAEHILLHNIWKLTQKSKLTKVLKIARYQSILKV